MKCPKCGYHSFEHLDSCKKCSADLSEHKAKFGLKGFFSPGQSVPEVGVAADEVAADTAATDGGDVDFGFDFLDEEGDAPATADSPTESVDAPADEPADELAGAFDEAADEAAEDDGLSLGDDEDVSLDQPFGIDGEAVPADDFDEESDEKKKPEPDSEFSF